MTQTMTPVLGEATIQELREAVRGEVIAAGDDSYAEARRIWNGMLFTTKGVINIKNKKWENDFSVLDEGLDCETSRFYTKAYLRHLFAAGEFLGLTIASIHNLAFYLHLVKEARKHILLGDFNAWKKEMVPILKTRL